MILKIVVMALSKQNLCGKANPTLHENIPRGIGSYYEPYLLRGDEGHMFTHKQVWGAIDTVADRHGFSASGLAKKAGLDPTSFNPSKRNGPDGRPRWPTMESINRVLDASGASVEEFMDLLTSKKGAPQRLKQIPLLGLAKAGKGGFFADGGFPAGNGWEEIEVPGVTDAQDLSLIHI